MNINKTQAERLIFLLKAQAKSFAEQERTMIAIARTLECLFDIDTERVGESKPVNAPVSQGNYTSRFMDPHNPDIALKANTEALAGISGITLSVHPRNETEELLERLQEDHGV